MADFTFDENSHTYHTRNGIVPGVTRILDHSGLVDYGMVRQEIMERKSILGSLVHQATHFADEQDLDFSSLSEDVKPRVDAWLSFRADTGFIPRRIEKRYIATVNSMTFGLTVDREGLFKKDEVIIDLKTSAVIADWCGIQLAGYALGVPDFDGKDVSPMALFYRRRRMIVQLLETGKYRKFDYNDKQDARVFISALHISNWKMAHGSALRKIEE